MAQLKLLKRKFFTLELDYIAHSYVYQKKNTWIEAIPNMSARNLLLYYQP